MKLELKRKYSCVFNGLGDGRKSALSDIEHPTLSKRHVVIGKIH